MCGEYCHSGPCNIDMQGPEAIHNGQDIPVKANMGHTQDGLCLVGTYSLSQRQHHIVRVAILYPSYTPSIIIVHLMPDHGYKLRTLVSLVTLLEDAPGPLQLLSGKEGGGGSNSVTWRSQ